MNKSKLYKLIFIIAIYSAAFTLLLISIKNYTSYLSTYKNNKTTQHTKVLSTKHIKKANCINKIQKNIAKSVLRLHVIANSDSDNDQNLKLKVRDSILHELQTGLNTATSPAQAKQYVASKFQNIKNTADYTIHQNGYSYSVKVFIQNRYFPVKHTEISHFRQDIMMPYVLKSAKLPVTTGGASSFQVSALKTQRQLQFLTSQKQS